MESAVIQGNNSTNHKTNSFLCYVLKALIDFYTFLSLVLTLTEL